MNVLLVSTSSGSHGGGEIYLRYLAAGLCQAGHEVGLWMSDAPAMDGLAASMASDITLLRGAYRNTYALPGRSPQAWWARRAVARAILPQWNGFAPDRILLNKQNLEDGLDLLYTAQQADAPSCCTIHLTQTARELGARLPAIRDALCRRILSAYRGRFVAVSEARAACLRQVCDDVPVEVVWNGIPRPEPGTSPRPGPARQRFHIPAEATVLLCVARLEPQKNPGTFFDRCELLLQRDPRLHAVWVGSGRWQATWRTRWARSPVADRLHHHEWVDDPTPWFRDADLYYHPAAYEGLPLAVLEALGHGLPTVLSEAVRQEAQPLRESHGVASDDPEGRWWERWRDPTARMQAAAAARATYATHFTLEAMTHATVEVLNRA